MDNHNDKVCICIKDKNGNILSEIKNLGDSNETRISKPIQSKRLGTKE